MPLAITGIAITDIAKADIGYVCGAREGAARTLLFIGGFCRRGFGLGPNVGEHAARHTNFHAFGDFHQDLVFIVDDLGNGANQAAIGNNNVVPANLGKHFLMLFDPLLLWANQQEIKDDENQDQRQERHHVKAAGEMNIKFSQSHEKFSPAPVRSRAYFAQIVVPRHICQRFPLE